MKNNKEETLKKWGELLDKMGLNDTSTTKINIAEMMEGKASKLLKEDMNKERYNQIIDEVYDKYLTKYVGYDDVPSKELILFEIKNNTEFSEKWGLKIEEKELSENERYKIFDERGYEFRMNNWSKEEQYDKANIPTKLITLEYNQEKIYIYE
jgi:hypothetical protein